MVNEFDKEIDAILRRARDADVAPAAEAHLEADAIAAFAENALPERARARCTAHLADCSRCRRILSNIIALEAETAAAAPADSAAAAETPAPAPVPWYRRLFVFPQVAYTLGALVLVFGGFLAFLVVQNFDEAGQVALSNTNAAAPPAANRSVLTNANSTTVTNTAATTANMTANAAPLAEATPGLSSSGAANSAAPSFAANGNAAVAGNTNAATAATPFTLDAATRRDDRQAAPEDDEAIRIAPPQPRPQVAAPSAPDTALAAKEKSEAESSANAQSLKKMARSDRPKPAATPSAAGAAVPADEERKSSPAGETRRVAGKTFNNVGGIWFDEAYNKQATKTVRRGSDAYRKLDAGLRSIAESLGGTVVAIWKGRAYRIE